MKFQKYTDVMTMISRNRSGFVLSWHVFFFSPLQPNSPSVSTQRALLPSISVHPLCMTNLHRGDREGRSGEGKEEEKGRKEVEKWQFTKAAN